MRRWEGCFSNMMPRCGLRGMRLRIGVLPLPLASASKDLLRVGRLGRSDVAVAGDLGDVVANVDDWVRDGTLRRGDGCCLASVAEATEPSDDDKRLAGPCESKLKDLERDRGPRRVFSFFLVAL